MGIGLALLSGGLIGVVLGLVGGGGSILAIPLLIYVVGVGSTHAAIGTSAVAVAANALAGAIGHARAGTVRWKPALIFSALGVIGAAAGAELGKAFDGTRLLILFGFLMVVVGATMFLKPQGSSAATDVITGRACLLRLLPLGGGVGLAAGFFGIGGGFLVVPALIAATSMPFVQAVGTSLVVIVALGLTTAVSYAVSGLVDWELTFLLVAGGVVGGVAGILLGRKLADRRGLLERIFAAMLILVGVYIAISTV